MICTADRAVVWELGIVRLLCTVHTYLALRMLPLVGLIIVMALTTAETLLSAVWDKPISHICEVRAF
jgi:hypothetical protein